MGMVANLVICSDIMQPLLGEAKREGDWVLTVRLALLIGAIDKSDRDYLAKNTI